MKWLRLMCAPSLVLLLLTSCVGETAPSAATDEGPTAEVTEKLSTKGMERLIEAMNGARRGTRHATAALATIGGSIRYGAL